MRAWKLVAYLLLSFAPVPASAINLMEAWRLALEQDPEYQAARYARSAGLEERAMGMAALLPVISWDYQQSRHHSEVSMGGRSEFRRYDSNASTWSLRQPLFDYEVWNRYRRGDAGARQAIARFRERQQDLILRLFRVWSQALLSREQHELLVAQKRALQEQYRLNKRLFQEGEGTRTDLLETQAQLSLADVRLMEQQNSLDIRLRELEAMTGVALTIQKLTPLNALFAPVPLRPQNFSWWLDLALKNNAQLQALGLGLLAAKYDIERQRAGHLPRVSLIASKRHSRSDTESSYHQRYNTDTVGIQIGIPIFSGGAVSAGVRQAQALYEQTQWEKDRETVAVQLALRQRFNLLTSTQAKIDALMQSVQSTLALISATRQSVSGGERINLDVLNAQMQYYSARSELVAARYDWLIAWLELHYYAGTLDDAILERVAGYFQVENPVSPYGETGRVNR
jgi:protease secretion system outer membrane protein